MEASVTRPPGIPKQQIPWVDLPERDFVAPHHPSNKGTAGARPVLHRFDAHASRQQPIPGHWLAIHLAQDLLSTGRERSGFGRFFERVARVPVIVCGH